MTRKVSYEEYINVAAKRLTVNIVDLIEAEVKTVGSEYVHELTLHFLARIIGFAVFRVLDESSQGKMTKKQKFEQVTANFLNYREGVQDAVALGFTSAMSTFANRDVEYYCKVAIVPEAKNKLHC